MTYSEAKRKKTIENILNNSSLLEEQKEKLKEFDKFNQANGLSPATRSNNLIHLKSFCNVVSKPFKKVKKKEIRDFLAKRSKEIEEGSLNQAKITLKKFYKWLNGKEKYPPKVNWISTTQKNNNGKLKSEDLISREELEKMVSVCDSCRDKALVYLLYETGCRRSEFLNLDVGDVSFDEYGAKVQIKKSKTEPRNVRILGSAVISLKKWLNQHKDKNKDDAPLFYSFSPKNYGERLKCFGLLKRIAKRAGIKKKIYPHLFRHSKATELAKKGYNEMVIRKFFGWAKNSNMTAIYVNLSKDLDEVFLKHEGIIDEDGQKKEKKLSEPVICPNCNTKNLPSNLYCDECGEKLEGDIEIKETIGKLMKLMLKDKKIKNRLEEKSNDSEWQELAEELNKSLH